MRKRVRRDNESDETVNSIEDDIETHSPESHTHIIIENSAARLAVLEKLVEVHERRITDIEDFYRSVVERFDQKIQLDAANHVSMEKNIAKAITSLDSLTNNLEKTLVLATEANKLSNKHETIGMTVFKIGGILGAIVAGVWALVRIFVIGG